MFITVTIQTYNRSGMLAETLESLRSLRCPPAAEYEILVVDNNSDDDTADIISRYTELLAPRLRSVFEPQQGLSHARNRALAEAKGEIVSFIDDDVKVDPGWLEAVAGAFEKYKASVVGGRSYLVYPESSGRPAWLPERREELYSRLDYGPEPLVDTDRELFGLNFSVVRDKAVEAGGFDSALGRCGNSLASGEEKDLLNRIRRAGGIAVYEPGAVVGHIVPPERLRKKWLLRRVYQGAISAERGADSQRAGLGATLMRLFRCWGSVGKGLLSRRLGPEEFFERQYYAAHSLGRFVATCRRVPKHRIPA